MSDRLLEICERRRADVESLKATTPLADMIARAQDAPAARGFIHALRVAEQAGQPGLIAEVKQASPSQGIIRADFDPVAIARGYVDAGAHCLSILTEPHYFLGKDAYLRDIRASVPVPVLRKDFTVDTYQIHEARLIGADCILIIMAALDDHQAADFYATATGIGLDVLVEVHDAAELERALRFNPTMVGVNNRNLKTLQVDLQTSHDLAPHMPPATLRVAESGIRTAAEVTALKQAGYTAFLVGESLLRQNDVSAGVAALLTA